MTVNTENIYSGPYVGNDISDTFSYGFRIQDETQLNVYKTDDEGNRELLTLTTDYTVTGVDNDLGGTITLVAGALPLDYEIFIEANYPATQDTAFASQGRFNPKIHEDALDKLTFLIKQLQYALTNTIQFAPGYVGASPVLPDPEAGDLIRWTEDGIEGLTIGELLSEASAIISQLNMNGNQIKDLAAATEAGDAINLTQATQLLAQSGVDGVVPNVFPTQTGDGVTVTFSTPASGTTGAVASSFFVHIDNAYQTPDVHFTVDAGTGDLTFVAAPPEDSNIYITYFNPVAIENPNGLMVTATGTTTPRGLADWTSKETLTYNNIAEVKADTKLDIGQDIRINNYSTIGGGYFYEVVAGGTGLPDDVLFVNLDNGLQAKRLPINGWSFDLRQDAINAEHIGVGDAVHIRGITTVGDLGAGRYLCVPAGTGVDDNGSILDLINGNQLALIPEKGVVFAEQFGVSGEESTDLVNLQAAIDYTSSNDLTLTGGINTVALLSNRLVIKTNTRFKAYGFTLKASASNPATNGKVFGAVGGTSDFELSGLIFDGGLDISNTTTNPLGQLFSCSNFTIEDCKVINNAGIGLNLSTNISNGNILRNKFSNIGYTDGVGGVNAKQGMAFSSGGHSNINIEYNEFEDIGLDCISIGGINTGTVANNKHTNDNCYALIYNDALSYNLDIHDNFAKTAVNVGGSARPQGLGIDLPKLVDSTVSDNICTGCSSAGLAIFADSDNVVVSNNVCSDNNKAGVAIHAAGIVIRSTTGPILLSNNISSNRVGSTQPTGFIIDNSQGSLINLDRSNKSHNCAIEVSSMTFASNVDVGTVQFSYGIPLELTGNGTPDGVYSAPIGSLFTRLDGGAGTTFYYKESGTGNTGWVAK